MKMQMPMPMPIPTPRDVFAEQRLVRELQHRIQAVAALREEEPRGDIVQASGSSKDKHIHKHIHKHTEHDASKAARAPSAMTITTTTTTTTSPPVMDGRDSGSDAASSVATEEGSSTLPWTAVGQKPTTNYSSTVKREAATNIFLGASGSLLDELKQNIDFLSNNTNNDTSNDNDNNNNNNNNNNDNCADGRDATEDPGEEQQQDIVVGTDESVFDGSVSQDD